MVKLKIERLLYDSDMDVFHSNPTPSQAYEEKTIKLKVAWVCIDKPWYRDVETGTYTHHTGTTISFDP